ncbi:glycosyltransferase family 2 protein [Pseudomonas sp. SWRI102]|uniref:Glycosyltransferase family 2 protein n=1 Tax=Pseudomonas marvdashtae TaxID=2745500 RepID=A0A923FP77_9PSED|nr:glycosyltransferase family A protein [Pseudomonas marvdashtae]MBV4553013.1 glycosyltransferase family 2 protein [Pseudomonas marvdashtae]
MIDRTPLVSIIVPSYNHAAYIRECIESIIQQTYKNIELIIIDDGSLDQSELVIAELSDLCSERFVRFEARHRPNKGLCATLNEAIEWCRGKYCSIIASDDLMLPEKTEMQVEYLEENLNCAAVFGQVTTINSESKVVNAKKRIKKSYIFNDIFLHKHTLPAPTQMIRSEKLKKTGGYPSWLIIEDWYMWLILASDGSTLDNLGVETTLYRRHAGNLSRRIEKMAQGRYDILSAYQAHPLYSSAVGNAILMSAIDVQIYNKLYAIKLALKAIGKAPSVIIQLRFVKFIVKLMVPKKKLQRYFEGEHVE